MLHYHHIGGRNGTFPLPLKKGPLADNFHLFLYDADPNSSSEMKKSDAAKFASVTILPYCVGEVNKDVLFNINFHPTTSSLYTLNRDFSEYSFVPESFVYGEYKLKEACKVSRRVPLKLYSLSKIFELTNQKNIDILSLDIQGAEYDVITGAQSLLKNNCLAIHFEAEFVELYKNQKTFFDLHPIMLEMGFQLIDLGPIERFSVNSVPIGFRGIEQPIYTEAVYIKKMDSLPDQNSVEKLYKHALICFIYGNIRMGLESLMKICKYEDPLDFCETDPAFKKMCKQIWAEYKGSEDLLLPSIGDLFTQKMFDAYYLAGKSETPEQALDEQHINSIKSKLEQLLHKQAVFASSQVSPLEQIFINYGLENISQKLFKNRMREASVISLLLDKYKVLKEKIEC